MNLKNLLYVLHNDLKATVHAYVITCWFSRAFKKHSTKWKCGDVLCIILYTFPKNEIFGNWLHTQVFSPINYVAPVHSVIIHTLNQTAFSVKVFTDRPLTCFNHKSH